MQYKILIVEDDNAISRLLAKILNEIPCQTIQAFSGTEAKLLLKLLIPRILLYAGMYFKLIYHIAMWLPQSFFLMINGNFVNTGECITAWDTPGGMTRCIASGAIGILIFSLSAITILRRQDL